VAHDFIFMTFSTL